MRRQLQSKLSASLIVVALVLCLSTRQPLNAAYPPNASTGAPRSLAEELFRRAATFDTELHAKPLEERSTGDYLRALDAYSQVIRLNADNFFAGEALKKRAELQREMADGSGDSALYQQAIGTLRQLIREHPHSAFVGDALIAIAQIYEENLQDLDGAIGAYRELVEYFPASVMAREARAVIARFESNIGTGGSGGVDVIAAKGRSDANETLTKLTNVRNFSGPNYARVVIDLSADASFTPTRLGDNRIAINLSSTTIAASLYGRRFIVGDTSLLKRIMVYENGAGESSAGVRVEIEVSALAEYSTFLLTEPSRLVIDLHAAAYLAKAGKSADAVASATTPETTRDVTTPTSSTTPAGTTNTAAAREATAKAANPSRPKLDGSEAIARANPSRAPKGQPMMALPEINEPIVPHNPQAAAAAVDARMLGNTAVRCIVIDAGHGGHDTGTISANGLREKDLTLDVARRLKGYIKRAYPDIEVVMTRDGDYYVALEQRTAVANARRADLFISVHANSSPSKAASGVETFFVSPDKENAKENAKENVKAPSGENAKAHTSDNARSKAKGRAKGKTKTKEYPQGLTVAELQRRAAEAEAAKAAGESVNAETATSAPPARQPRPAVATAADKPQPVVASVTIGSRVAESRELARYIQSGLVRGIGAASPRTATNRGVKHAGFVVLMGAAMPSVLAEVSFLSNPKDEALLMTGQFRERIAASLFAGLNAYLKKNRPAEAKAK